jgi:hypothetical protein
MKPNDKFDHYDLVLAVATALFAAVVAISLILT